MVSRWKICQCNELGCDQEAYKDDETGEDQRGKAWSVPSFKKHLQAILKKRSQDEKVMAAQEAHQEVDHGEGRPQTIVGNATLGLEAREKARRDGHCIMESESFSSNSFQLVPQHSLTTMLQAAKLSLITRLGDKNIAEFLKAEREKVEKLSKQYGFEADGKKIIENIPLSKAKLLQRLGLDLDLHEEICCPECFKLYEIPKIPTDDESVPEIPKTCTSVFYSESKKFLKQNENNVKLCDAKLVDLDSTGRKIKINPIKSFSFQPLKMWLARKLWIPAFETLLDSNLRNSNPENGSMSDVWDGSVWKGFQGPQDSNDIFTSKPGHLVFSLYIDWFNPYGNKAGGKSVSLGAIVLVCLNLPLGERYKVENMYLFGVIPGPKEPKLDQMNHILEPLVSELMEFWKGVWFTKTSQFPHGRLIFAAIFPLIGDLPAIRKTAGFASHSATKFCSFCEITLPDINNINIQSFGCKTHEGHMERVRRWEACTTHEERENIATQEGARGSVLNKLPYWRPVEYCGIEVMHVQLLGNLKDHSYTFLDAYSAGKALKKRVELETNWKKKDSGRHIFKGLKFPESKRKKTPEDDSSGTEDEGHGRKIRLLSSKNLSRLSRIEEDTAGSSRNNSRLMVVPSRQGARSATRSATASNISVETASSESSAPRYQLRARSVQTVSSLASGSEVEDNENVMGVRREGGRMDADLDEGEVGEKEAKNTNEPRITKDELRALQNVISQTQVPTWVSRVPRNFGLSGAGSLKAADWLILYTVYYPLALVPYWIIGNDAQRKNIKGSTTVTHQDILRDSTIYLIEITNLLMKHHLKESDIMSLSNLIREYRNTLRMGWPDQNSKPNLHLCQHYPEVIKRFGPPMATAAWAQERLNGMLGKIPNNHHIDEIHRTITNTWNQKALYYGLTKQNSLLPGRNLAEGHQSNHVRKTMPARKQKKELDFKLYNQWKEQWVEFGVRAGVELEGGRSVLRVKSVVIFNRNYVAAKDLYQNPAANSNVEVLHKGERRYGRISLLFALESTEDIWFVVRPFTHLNRWDQPKNPYKDHLRLNTNVYYSTKFEKSIVVHHSRVVGHVAILKHEEGTFGISRESMSVVSLGSVAWSQAEEMDQ